MSFAFVAWWWYFLLYWSTHNIIYLERYDGLQTYPDIGQAAFGFVGRICIALSIYANNKKFPFFFLEAINNLF